MYFKSVALKDKKPNTGLLRNKVVLINAKTKEVTSFQLGFATDWEWYVARGYTHWIKQVSATQLEKEFNKKPVIFTGKKPIQKRGEVKFIQQTKTTYSNRLKLK
jgi:hypothetical protein